MKNFDEFLSGLQPRLAADKFCVSGNVVLPDGRVVALVASRTHWNAGGLLLSQHFFVVEMDDPTDKDVDDLYEAGLRYAKIHNRVPLLRGMMFGYEIIPCIVTRNASRRLRSYVTGPPTVRWAQAQFPIVFDLAAGEAHYFRGTTVWGMVLWPDLQYLAVKHIEDKPVDKGEELRRRSHWQMGALNFGGLFYGSCAPLSIFLSNDNTLILIGEVGFFLCTIPMFFGMRQSMKAEKEAMQARFDAEDIALFGKPLRELMDTSLKTR